MNSMEIKKLSADQDFQSVINNINDYLKKINDYQVNHQSEFGLPIEELGQFRKSWFYNNWQARFRKVQSFNGLGLTGVINTPNTTFEEWMWWFHEWTESFMDDYNNFKELMFQVLLVIEKHQEAVDSELQDHENRIADNTERLDNGDVKLNQYDQRLKAFETQIELDQLVKKPEFETVKDELNNSPYYGLSDVSIKVARENNTHTYFSKVNSNIKPHVYNTSGSQALPSEFAKDNLATLAINAGLSIPINPDTGLFRRTNEGNFVWKQPIVISKGAVIVDELTETSKQSLPYQYEYVAYKADGSMAGYQANVTTAQMMLDDGVTDAFMAQFRLIKNGVPSDLTNIIRDNGEKSSDKVNYPSASIGVLNDGSYGFAVSDGRTLEDLGMDMFEWQAYLQKLGFRDAWMIDGGGSASFSYKGTKLNKNLDLTDDVLSERPISFAVAVIKDVQIPNSAKEAYKQSADVSNLVKKSYSGILTPQTSSLVKNNGYANIETVADYNKWLDSLVNNEFVEIRQSGVIKGTVRLDGELTAPGTAIAIFTTASRSTRKSNRFLYTFTCGGGLGNSYLKLQSFLEPDEVYVMNYDEATSTWGSWHLKTIPKNIYGTTVLNNSVTNLHAMQSDGGIVSVMFRATEELGETWVKFASGLPKVKGGFENVEFTFMAYAGDVLRIFIDQATGDLYGRWHHLGAGRDTGALKCTFTYPADQYVTYD